MALVVLAALCGTARAEAIEVREVECWIATNAFQDADCYRIVLPLDREDLAAGTVDLPVAVLRASTDSPRADPVIYLEGGPGGPAFQTSYPEFHDYSGFWWDHTTPFRRTRDFILFDQRGIGLAVPDLDCEELHEIDAGADPTPGFDDPLFDAELAALGACYRRLRQEGVALEFFDTRNSADDVADIVRALGYESVNLYGASYGTRLALEVMRRHPGLVRSAVLDGVYPPDIDFELEFPGVVAGAFANLFQDCAGDIGCRKVAPDAGPRLEAMVDELDGAPRELELADRDWYEAGTMVRFDGALVISNMVDALYDPYSLIYIPLVVGRAARGDLDMLTWFYGSQSFASQGLVEGSLVNVECRESTTLDAGLMAEAARPFGVYGRVAEAWSLAPYCAVWPVARAPLAEGGPVVSDVPTLLMSGRYDPVTPAAFAERAAATLSASAHLLFRSGGHAVSFGFLCGRDSAAAFIETPDPTTVNVPRCRDFSQAADFAERF